MHDDIFERLEQATSEEQKTWVITEAILKSLPIALAEAVIAVAVPHWFNLTILAALLQVKSKEVERLYYGLQALPFTETFGDLGYTLHNLTRSAILFHLISNHENLFRTYSQRVYNHYAQFEDTQNIVEAIYHLLISEKTVGLEALTKTMEFFRNKSNLSAANRLIAAADELIKFKLLDIEDAERIKWYKYLLTAEINDTQKISFIKIAKTPTANKSERFRILFLASDPTDTARLRLGQELREIQEKLQLSKRRNKFSLTQRLSVRPSDISQAILDEKPQIVHFSGHGIDVGGLCFEDELGHSKVVEAEALGELFKLVSDHVDCVLLNTCYSAEQAQAIASHIRYVIGINNLLDDQAAILFSIGFYQALGAGKSIEEAYEFGCVHIKLHAGTGSPKPVLLKG